jgi:hypothetical protein
LDRLPFLAAPKRPAFPLARGLFFGAGPTCAGQTHALLRSPRKPPSQFLSAPLDGLFIQASDLGEQPISPCAKTIGLHRHIPATLLIIQPTQQQIHLPMQPLIWMGHLLLAMGTLALMYLSLWHS